MTNYSAIQVSIVGFGNVGRALLHLLLQEQHRQFHINIIDPSDQALGARYDLGPAQLLLAKHELFWNSTDHLKKADFIFYSAGVAVPKGECRDFKVEENRAIVSDVFGGITFKQQPTIITLTNPLDAIALDILVTTNLSPSQVVGIGTIIESARLKYYLQQMIRTGGEKIDTLVIGEHGETMVPVLSQTMVNGTPIRRLLTGEQIQKCIFQVRTTPHKIKETQPASFYAATSATINLFYCLLRMQSPIIPISTFHEKDEIFYSMPSVISTSGISNVSIKLDKEEQESLEFSKEKIRSMSVKLFA